MEPSNKLLERAIEVQLEEKIKNFDKFLVFPFYNLYKQNGNKNYQR